MTSIELTFKRALKVWWGFMWRGWLVSMPLVAIMMPLMYWLMPFTKNGEKSGPISPTEVPGFAGKLFLLWVVMVVGLVITQTFAIRWLMKAKWSDFKLLAVAQNREQTEDVSIRS